MSPGKTEQNILKFSLALVILLMIWGLIFTEITNSNIITLDAGSYIISGLLGLITLYISSLQNRPSDRKHPLGYAGFVPILNMMRSFMILLICLKSISASIGDFINGPEEIIHANVFLYAGITLFINCVAYFVILRAARSSGSVILRIDALEWKFDIFFNISVLISFGISYLFRYHGYNALANHTDPVFCTLLSIAMCFPVVKLFGENLRKLSIRSVDAETYKRIRHRFSQEFPSYKDWNPQMTTIDMSGILWVELQFDERTLSSMELPDWHSVEQKGKEILSEITEHHHLSFRLVTDDQSR